MAIFDKQQRKIKRSARLISVLSKYGLQDVLIRLNLRPETKAMREGVMENLSSYQRIRLALEELGPTFVKLAQAFSERDDLLPEELISELRQLQDRVPTLDLDVQALLLESFGASALEAFDFIDPKPIAAASIAQVYKASLSSGEQVIVKVKRPGIAATITDDLLILKDLIALVDSYSDIVEQINLKSAIQAFEKSLLEELSLNKERENLLLFAKNFQGNPEIYVPKVYGQWSNNDILVMEYIQGIKVTDTMTLLEQGHSPVEISERGYRLFVTQILEHGFFHADPHAGNLLVNAKGQLVFIDFGAMGRIPQMDIPLFENLILGFMANKPSKVVRYLKKLALYYKIPDERRFEMEVMELLNYVHQSTLSQINIAFLMDKMKEVLKENRLAMPEYFYLLFKGISLMDGVGRQLNPDLDVVQSLKPFTQKIIQHKLSPDQLAKTDKDKLTDMLDHMEEIPKEMRSLLSKLDENRFHIHAQITQYRELEQLVKSSVINIILGMLLAANIIATGLVIAQRFWWLSAAGILISVVLGSVLLLRILRR